MWLLLSFAVAADIADPTLIHTSSGPIQGVIENVYAAPMSKPSKARTFKGIPFANVKRWQPPLPVKPWSQTRPALQAGPTCEAAENCLFLNVNTPWPLPTGEQSGLAVLLFIHGGCNKGGAGSQYQTEELVAAAQDVIVVTFNYRLGIFGWLGGNEVAANSGDGSSGNFGTQDTNVSTSRSMAATQTLHAYLL